MAKTATATELRGMTRTELNAKVTELKEELFGLRFAAATGQLESPGRLRAVKRDIARIYTVLRERELGIRATPVAVEAPAKAEKKTTKKAKAKDASTDAPEADAVETKEA
jgi:large subunit ribosomal protein L29